MSFPDCQSQMDRLYNLVKSKGNSTFRDVMERLKKDESCKAVFSALEELERKSRLDIDFQGM